MTKDEALKLALEALDTAWTNDKDNADGYYFEAITAVKEALAQPVQPDAKDAERYRCPPGQWQRGAACEYASIIAAHNIGDKK